MITQHNPKNEKSQNIKNFKNSIQYILSIIECSIMINIKN